ncbi:MAG: metal-dependent hydrolase, partial [Candidatus Bathyarchaeia archaeon]
MRATWFGHASFLFEIGGKKILIDPFIKDNPMASVRPEEIDDVDIVLVTHDHFDHLGDAVDIMQRTGASTVAVHELAEWFKKQDVKGAVGANVGGTVRFEGVSVTIVPAIHTCTIGVPVGYVVSNGDESVYHAGDTSYMAEMQFIGKHLKPKVSCLPVGGHYTMDVDQAAYASSSIRSKFLIPMHYNTWDIIKVNDKDIERLGRSVRKFCRLKILKP